MEPALSAERLSKYRKWARQNEDEALALYSLNLMISESLYIPLHVLEVSLRNAIHHRLRSRFGPDWFRNPDVINTDYQKAKYERAMMKLKTKNPTDTQILVEFTFGYWVAMFGRNYTNLWGEELRQIFDAEISLKRKHISKRLDQARQLRNRIAHHESVIQWDLELIHRNCCELIGWISQDALIWCNSNNRFQDIHPNIPIIIGNLKNPNLLFEGQ